MMNGELLPADAPGLDRLLELNLASPIAHAPHLHAAISPRHAQHIAGSVALSTLRHVAEDAQATLAFLAQLAEELPLASQAPESPPSEPSRLLSGVPAIDAVLEELVESAQSEILTAQPSAARPEIISAISEFRDGRAMRRGVLFRTIYSSRACSSAPAAAYAKNSIAHGNQIRHTPHPFQRMILVDRKTAIVSAVLESHEKAQTIPPPSAWLITDPGAVSVLGHQFELAWTHAQPWDTTRQGAACMTNALQRQILRGVTTGGRTQAQVASDLKITASYVSTSLNKLRSKLALTTKEQVIAWWTTSPEQHIDDA